MYPGHPDQIFGHITYSQHGEDLLIANLFKLMGIERPSYLDIGAHHPTRISNTALLYSRGSRGINVEANPFLIGEFNKQRVGDVNLNFAVASDRGQRTLYMYDDESGINSMKPEMFHEIGYPINKKIQVECRTIMDIVTNYWGAFPDLLLTDVEGMDLEIIQSANFEVSSPKIICTEVRGDEAEIMKNLLFYRGYHGVVRVMANMIFVRDDYRHLCFE